MDALANIGPFHVYERNIPENADHENFQTAFLESGVLNYGWVGCSAVADDFDPSSDTRTIRRHTVQIAYLLALNDAGASGTTFHTRRELILNDLRTGDRTLGGACKTYGRVKSTQAVVGRDDGARPFAHRALFTLEVEEIL